MWQENVIKIAQEKNKYGKKINYGATEEELQNFIKLLNNQLNIQLPNDYKKILKFVNGLEFNGFILYGIDEVLLQKPPNQAIYGLVEYNEIWYENEWQKQYVFLGESNISWYAYDVVRCRYCELDNPSGSLIEEYNNLESLLEKMLSDALM